MTTSQRGCLVIVGLLVFAAIMCAWLPFVFMPSNGIAPAIPVIQVPGEVLVYHWKPLGIELGDDFNLINTMVAVAIVDVIVLAIMFFARRASNNWTNEIPGRFQGFVELIADGIYGITKSIGGIRIAKTIFPLIATITLFLLIANWMSLIPGVESFGLFHCAYPEKNGYDATRVSGSFFQLRNEQPLNGGETVSLEEHVACVEQTGLGELHGKVHEDAVKAGLVSEDHHAAVPANAGAQELLEGHKFHITPFVRPAASDLNLTLGLALISFCTIQYFGFRAQGLNYLQKFFPLRSMGNLRNKPLGAIDLIVGPLELVSELSKIVSLSFRLFGNIFAGAILLAVMLFLVGTGLPVIFYILELVVGLAQALVFAVLTLVFASQAMEGHHGDEEHAEH